MKYLVHFTNTTSTTVTVEADDPDAAVDAAYSSDALPGDMPGEWLAIEVADEDNKVVWTDSGGLLPGVTDETAPTAGRA